MVAKSLPIYSSWLPPYFSVLHLNQHEALSAASPILRAAVFLSFPVIPMAVSILHPEGTGNPLQPPSTGNSHACHPPPLQSCRRSWYLALFHSKACSHPSSHGTVSSMRMIFFASSDHSIISSLRVVWTIWGNFNLPPRSTFISHDWAFCSKQVHIVAVVGGFYPPLTNWIDVVYRSGWHFFCISLSKVLVSVMGILSWRHLYLPWVPSHAPLVQVCWGWERVIH